MKITKKKLLRMVRESIRDVHEARKQDKLGVPREKLLDVIKKYVDVEHDAHQQKYFITFTQLNKVGLNPRSQHGTPNGIYCYPLSLSIFRELRRGDIPYASGEPYISIIERKNDIAMVGARSARKDMSEQEFVRIVKKLYSQGAVAMRLVTDPAFVRDIKRIGKTAPEVEDVPLGAPVKDDISRFKPVLIFQSESFKFAAESAEVKTNFGILWNLARLAVGNPRVGATQAKFANKWSALWRFLGFGGAYDHWRGIIHPSEREQAVFFSKGALNIIGTYDNVLTPERRRLEQRPAERELLVAVSQHASHFKNQIFRRKDLLNGPNMRESRLWKFFRKEFFRGEASPTGRENPRSRVFHNWFAADLRILLEGIPKNYRWDDFFDDELRYGSGSALFFPFGPVGGLDYLNWADFSGETIMTKPMLQEFLQTISVSSSFIAKMFWFHPKTAYAICMAVLQVIHRFFMRMEVIMDKAGLNYRKVSYEEFIRAIFEGLSGEGSIFRDGLYGRIYEVYDKGYDFRVIEKEFAEVLRRALLLADTYASKHPEAANTIYPGYLIETTDIDDDDKVEKAIDTAVTFAASYAAGSNPIKAAGHSIKGSAAKYKAFKTLAKTLGKNPVIKVLKKFGLSTLKIVGHPIISVIDFVIGVKDAGAASLVDRKRRALYNHYPWVAEILAAQDNDAKKARIKQSFEKTFGVTGPKAAVAFNHDLAWDQLKKNDSRIHKVLFTAYLEIAEKARLLKKIQVSKQDLSIQKRKTPVGGGKLPVYRENLTKQYKEKLDENYRK